MKRSLHTLISMVGILLVISNASFAYANEGLPVPLKEAAAAYKSRGAGEFLPTLLKGSHLLYEDRRPLVQAVQMLKDIETHFGNYLGLELVSSVPVTTSTRVVYFVLNFERGPLYGVVSVYRAKNGEIVTNSNLNTQWTQIIPAGIIVGTR